MTDILNWEDTGTSPTPSLIKNGYKGGDSPQAEHFNYIFNNFSTCIQENREKIQESINGILIPDNSDGTAKDLSQITEPGIYFGDNSTNKYSGKGLPTYKYSIPPGDNRGGQSVNHDLDETNGIIIITFNIQKFMLEVSKTPDEKIYQSLSFYDNSNQRITFERFQTDNGFNDWKNITPKTNRLLWSGCMFMQEGQNIYFKEDWQFPENQDKGIVLVWSKYYRKTIENPDNESNQAFLTYNFIPKEFFEDPPTEGESKEGHYNSTNNGSAFFLAHTGYFGLKYLGLRKDQIVGDSINNQGTTNSGKGIIYDNDQFVLRYVIGV